MQVGTTGKACVARFRNVIAPFDPVTGPSPNSIPVEVRIECVRTVIMQDANYRGYVSLEFEGKDDPTEAVAKSLRLLRSHFS